MANNGKIMTLCQRRHAVAAACIGNCLEWFDFGIYGYFAIVIGKLFFPAENGAISTLVSFSVFAGGFIMRPLGSLVIGGYSDRHGRKNAILLTIACMGLGSGMIAFVPTYASIGIAAPILITIARLLQGFSSGGEIGAATTLLVESADERHRGFFVSLQFITQALSTMISIGFGAILFSLLNDEQIYSWGWRIPFIFSLLIIPVGLYIRANINESLAEDEKYTAGYHPVREIIGKYPRNFIAAIGMVIPAATMNYMLLNYIPTYMQIVSNLNSGLIYTMTMVAPLFQIAAYFSGGILYDRIVRWNFLKTPKIFPIICYCIAISLIMLMILNINHPTFFFMILAIAPFFTSIGTPINITLIAASFPSCIRTTVIAVSYSISVTIFGGTTPMVVSALMEISNNNPLSSMIWLLPTVFLGLLSYWFFSERGDKKIY
ncbi:MAG: proline/betaine transporter [Candidatus Tokpelaia sp. JSC189]|nr:MAG: proline/betaine transporter [Candidatus Tokpelaia sp. JSC189]